MIDLAAIRATGGKPRVHGNGFVQLDMPDNKRLHVFGHPDIPAQVVNTAIHDHRFSFTSSILRGCLRHEEFVTGLSDSPTHEVHSPVARYGEDTELVPTGERVILRTHRTGLYPAGADYRFDWGALHETTFTEPTVTVITKLYSMPNYKVRVLVPINQKPDNDFDRYAHDETLLWHVLEDMTRGL